MNLKSARIYEPKDTGYPSRRNASPLADVRIAGCLFHDMMKDHGLDGCRNRACNCPFAGKKDRKQH